MTFPLKKNLIIREIIRYNKQKNSHDLYFFQKIEIFKIYFMKIKEKILGSSAKTSKYLQYLPILGHTDTSTLKKDMFSMEKQNLFKWKHYQPDIILLTVRCDFISNLQ